VDKRQRSYHLEYDRTGLSTVSIGDFTLGKRRAIDPPITLDFDIVRNILSSTNVGTFRVYNLSLDVRNELQHERYKTSLKDRKGIELKAGYGDSLSTVFKGNIKQAWSAREGVNMVTTIECFDGGTAFVNGMTEKSYPPGTPYNAILLDLMKSLPKVNIGAVGIFPQTLTPARGAALNGNTIDILNEMTGGKFFIDNEKAYCLNEKEVIIGSLLVIDASAGLLNTPIIEDALVKFDIIFEPRLLIGQGIGVVSTTNPKLNGTYKTLSVKHRGTISEGTCGTAITTVGLWRGRGFLPVGAA
jgi:hypothetical protein